MRDVLAPQAIVGHDGDGILGNARLGPLGVAEGADAATTHATQIDRIELKNMHLDLVDFAHFALPLPIN